MTKNGFMLYCDQIEMIEMLSDEEAGRLIKAIYNYANDKTIDPELNDFSTKIVFVSIKKSLERNKIKYEKRCERNKINAEKRWGKSNKN